MNELLYPENFVNYGKEQGWKSKFLALYNMLKKTDDRLRKMCYTFHNRLSQKERAQP